ncbi:hypothetical protein BCR34DRAFT_272634 [Clohesyomyces aquaticus]|uniref:Uncharacterized protein n=1 Tax=Clohesyomyces aquaticus TaxID=1231657 RepID=A0A1Y1ZSU3_9PLEO|nr:hypothetical protein BCR34DRAFT_272634 [Clohesyomyces aquaticus]
MALPALQSQAPPALYAEPAGSQRELLAAARRAQNVKRRAGETAARPAGVRRQSLRRVKDSREELRRTRTRGLSSATIESSTGTTATPSSGRSFTVANINHGIIYLRYGAGLLAAGRVDIRLVQSSVFFASGAPLCRNWRASISCDSLQLPSRVHPHLGCEHIKSWLTSALTTQARRALWQPTQPSVARSLRLSAPDSARQRPSRLDDAAAAEQ